MLNTRLLIGETTPIPTPATCFIAKLPHPFVIEIAGSDASKVVHNLSTNDILKLPSGGHCETFITDARGWIVAHAIAIRHDTSLWLVGSHESASKICNHLDRYIIREDARVMERTAEHTLFVLDCPTEPAELQNDDSENALVQLSQFACRVPLVSRTSRLIGVHQDQFQPVDDWLAKNALTLATTDQFEWRRISHFWPLSPADIGDKTIPQELDRDRQAISFTKGCYLGQETIARLDARGQLQKKLCLVEIVSKNSEQSFQAGDAFLANEKEAGHITSVAREPSSARWLALALLRRGNFAPGTQLQCQSSQATVLEIPG